MSGAYLCAVEPRFVATLLLPLIAPPCVPSRWLCAVAASLPILSLPIYLIHHHVLSSSSFPLYYNFSVESGHARRDLNTPLEPEVLKHHKTSYPLPPA